MFPIDKVTITLYLFHNYCTAIQYSINQKKKKVEKLQILIIQKLLLN